MKTRQCDECKYWDRKLDRCQQEHAPRFYKPTLMDDESWGFKRKCSDYEEKK